MTKFLEFPKISPATKLAVSKWIGLNPNGSACGSIWRVDLTESNRPNGNWRRKRRERESCSYSAGMLLLQPQHAGIWGRPIDLRQKVKLSDVDRSTHRSV